MKKMIRVTILLASTFLSLPETAAAKVEVEVAISILLINILDIVLQQPR
jgi:hypothetical protein